MLLPRILLLTDHVVYCIPVYDIFSRVAHIILF